MKLTDKLWKRGQDFLGVKYPIISGAMTWISTSALVKTVCDHGGFGVLAAGNMPPEMLEQEIDKCRQTIPGPFGVNLITIAANFPQHLEIVAKANVPVVVFAGRTPGREEVRCIKDSGKKVMTFAPAESVARRMLKFGADALIIEGTESGGHIGPVSTMVLLQDILFKMSDTPIFVAGGIATGRMVAHLLLMGAAGVQLGTRFVLTEECEAHPEMKKTLCRAQTRHAATSTQVDPRLPIVSVRALQNPATEEFAQLQINLIGKIAKGEITREEGIEQVETFWIGGLRKAAIEGDVERGSVMAGQCVGLMDEVLPMAKVFEELVEGAETELQRVRDLF